MSGASVVFTDVVRDASGGNTKIPQSEYQASGSLPVIDQGKDFVAGYTDDESYAFRSDTLPVVVFGDHTRAVKFVDFPFAMGADGVKVLKPDNNCDPKFLYHYLLQSHIPNAGYSRHYKFVKRLRFTLPPLPEQRRIAAVLDTADALRAKRREAIAKLDRLLQSVFLDMFGDPIRNDCGWPIVPLAEAVKSDRPITYGILKPGPDMPGGIPYVRVVDIREGEIRTAGVKRTTREIARAYKRSSIRSGDLLMSIRGHVGRIGVVPDALDGANITQDTARISVCESFDTGYISGLLNTESMQEHMRRFTRGAAVQGINLKDVREIPVPVAPKQLQSKFALVALKVVSLRQQSVAQLQASSEIFLALQNQAFGAAL